MSKKERRPTTDKLAEALSLAGASQWMIDNANAGYYDDFKTNLHFPINQLVLDAMAEGLLDIELRAKRGEFNAQDWEADEWSKSPEGQATFAELLKEKE
jgi:hypothetical protein